MSAFLFREGWGAPGESVTRLPNGVQVVNGVETAMLLWFPEPDGQSRFHALVRQYAKKDRPDQSGLIADSWWQPFYYARQQTADFEPIALVVLQNEGVEATLTVPRERADAVKKVVETGGAPAPTVDVRHVWVNPAFARFLNGGYR